MFSPPIVSFFFGNSIQGYVYATGINPDPQLIPSGIPVGEYIFNIRLYEYKPENFLGKIKAVVDFL